MKNYNRIFKIAVILSSMAIFFSTMMMFVLLVYKKDMEDIMADPTGLSQLILRWPLWGISALVCLIPGIGGLVYGNKLKEKAREEALRID
ncbi:MAG: hypothetical protein JXB33_07935 [Clostridia bacterium]|nr:hypothetical protein [Clostridia bacterium]